MLHSNPSSTAWLLPLQLRLAQQLLCFLQTQLTGLAQSECQMHVLSVTNKTAILTQIGSASNPTLMHYENSMAAAEMVWWQLQSSQCAAFCTEHDTLHSGSETTADFIVCTI